MMSLLFVHNVGGIIIKNVGILMEVVAFMIAVTRLKSPLKIKL